MDDPDLAIRNLTYSRFVELGRAPTAAEVSASADLPASDVTAAWRRLHDAGVAGTISTECADCGTEIEVSVRAEAPSDPTLLFHCLVPAGPFPDDRRDRGRVLDGRPIDQR